MVSIPLLNLVSRVKRRQRHVSNRFKVRRSAEAIDIGPVARLLTVEKANLAAWIIHLGDPNGERSTACSAEP